jgi:hypothetical protein
MQMNHAVAEPVFVEQLEVYPHVVRERPFAASHHYRRQEQVALVDQASLEGLAGELGTTDGHVPLGGRLQLPNRLRIEI